jgi:hypothetical protein
LNNDLYGFRRVLLIPRLNYSSVEITSVPQFRSLPKHPERGTFKYATIAGEKQGFFLL